nr:MAG TPA: hypothetical protein [Bacteriophage sp.]
MDYLQLNLQQKNSLHLSLLSLLNLLLLQIILTSQVLLLLKHGQVYLKKLRLLI